MGTEQEQNGLMTEQEADAFFKDVFGDLVGGKHTTAFEKEPDGKTPVQQEEKQEVNQEVETTETTDTTTAAAVDGVGTEVQEQQQDNSDPLKDLPEEAKKIFAQLVKDRDTWRQKYKSDEGRWLTFKTRADQLETKVKELSTASTTTANYKFKSTDEWKQLAENDPALAKLIENAVHEGRIEAEQRVAAELQPLKNQQIVREQNDERAELLRMVPNLDEVLASDTYKDWFESQPANVTSIGTSAIGAYRLLQMYDVDMKAKYPQTQKENKSTDTQVVVDPKVAQQANKVQEARNQRVQVTNVKNVAASPPSQEVSDMEYYKKVYNSFLHKRT